MTPRHIPSAQAVSRQSKGASASVGPLQVVVLLSGRPADSARWLNVFSEHASACGYTIVTVTTDPLAAMAEIVAGRADRILVRFDADLSPLVEIVTRQSSDVPISQRRPKRLRST